MSAARPNEHTPPGTAVEPTGIPPAGDEIENTLLEVRALIDYTVATYRNQAATVPAVSPVAPDEATVTEEVVQTIGRAERRIDVMLAADPERARRLAGLLHAQAIRRGGDVRVRILLGKATCTGSFVEEHRAAPDNVEVRLVRMPVVESVIVDSRAAVVFAETPGGPKASVTRSAGVLRTLSAMFSGVWRNAVPLTDRIDLGDRIRTELARRILACLYAGVTDEVAARALSVSVRTYRRYVAQLMELVGATSRFQAGVHAADLSLLPVHNRHRACRRPDIGSLDLPAL